MPIANWKDELNDFGPILERYREALAQLTAWGIRIAPNSRLRMYETRLAVADGIAPGLVGSDFALPFIVDLREIDGIESATFLTAAQKRDIFYNNAARFLRLAPATSPR